MTDPTNMRPKPETRNLKNPRVKVLDLGCGCALPSAPGFESRLRPFRVLGLGVSNFEGFARFRVYCVVIVVVVVLLVARRPRQPLTTY